MFISFGSNIASIAAQRKLGKVIAEEASVSQRLSSGLRVNRPSDDAAALAVASGVGTDRRVYSQGVRNLNDGLSLLAIADGGIDQLKSIVIRLKELAEQAANGTYGAKQRAALDSEAQALSREYLRIIQTTRFNDRSLFSGDFGELWVQGGYGETGGIRSVLGGAVGNGTFGAAVSYAVDTNQSFSVALGDLNGDGILDMVSAGRRNGVNDGTATIRLGRGDGTFGADTTYLSEGLLSREVKLRDLNGDGVLDLITAGMDDANVGYTTVRLGAGNGTFGASRSYFGFNNVANTVDFADLNGDGVLDLVAGGTSGTSGLASVRLGAGDGSFGSAVTYNTQLTSTNSLELRDMNSDGIVDLVTAGSEPGANGRVTVLLGIGNGTFGTSISFRPYGINVQSMRVADINNDGVLDAVVGGIENATNGFTTVLFGNGDGTFRASASYVTESFGSYSLALGDLNGDGIIDMVTAGENDGPTGQITLRLGLGGGTFGSALSYSAESLASNELALGDLNNDGVLDVVSAGLGNPTGGFTTVRLGGTTSGASPLLPFSLATRADALAALMDFGQTLEHLTAHHGRVGALQSRVEAAARVLGDTRDTFASVESVLIDADVAQEAARLVSSRILKEAAVAVLAQANRQPEVALGLLRSANR